jgi:hypothetical protein
MKFNYNDQRSFAQMMADAAKNSNSIGVNGNSFNGQSTTTIQHKLNNNHRQGLQKTEFKGW